MINTLYRCTSTPGEILTCFACKEPFMSTGEWMVEMTEVCSCVCYLNVKHHYHMVFYIPEAGHA